MITLLERRAAPAVEALGLGWRRQSRAPSIRRDGGTYDADLDRFLADLPLNGVRSQHSQRSYAYDLLVWVRFLDEARGKTVWQATRDDVDDYHRARRHDDPPNRISGASWNRAVAALDKLYRWAVEDFPGWQADTSAARTYDDIPSKAMEYIAFVQETLGVPVSIVSVGPERSSTIERTVLFDRPAARSSLVSTLRPLLVRSSHRI